MPVLFDYAPPWAWALGCAVLALFYALNWPRRRAEGMPRGPRWVVLRWFHPLVWVLLGTALGLHAVASEQAREIARVLSVVALVTYIAFAAALLLPRKSA